MEMFNRDIDLNSVMRTIQNEIDSDLMYSGIKYRIFSRIKTHKSISKKLNQKRDTYIRENRKMQDVIGVRITLYHIEDVDLVHKFLKNNKHFVSEEVDEKSIEVFRPIRLNLIMRIPENLKEETLIQLKSRELIDLTYEIQIRTVFSEGWHEVEHDMRYKCKDDWQDIPEYNRRLNGIFASLENAEWAMQSLFEKLAYDCYKSCKWNQMLRNKMRVNFSDDGLSPEVIDYFQNNNNVVKAIFKTPRKLFISIMLKKKIKVSLKYDHVVFILNRISGHIDDGLKNLEGEIIKQDLDKMLN